MVDRRVDAERRFDRLVDTLGDSPGLTAPGAERSKARRFGSNTLKVHGKIFAMLVDGRLVVKLPRDRVDALVDAGHGAHFATGAGRPMKEWFALDAASTKRWAALAREAMVFVSEPT